MASRHTRAGRLIIIAAIATLITHFSPLATAQKSGPAPLQELKTRPERTHYAETSRYDDVMEFLKVVDGASARIHLTTFGYSFEGRPLPLAVVGTMKDATPEAVRAAGKTRVYIQGNIHAGEVEGKEACLELLRAIALGQHKEWLDSMILLVGPIYNPDGNDRINLTNRGGQHGPIGGMGQRATAQNYDLNRDHMKLDAPESRSLARMLQFYDPHVFVDLHTTNGTAHAYHLTYAPPLHPATAPAVTELLRTALLPAITKAVKDKYGWDYYYYGNVPGGRGGGAAERAWYTTEPTPRYSANYIGLRNRLGILSETFAYLTFAERIQAARRFLEEICNYVHRHGEEVRRVTAEADGQSIVGQQIPILSRPVKSAAPVEILMGEVATERNPYTGAMMRRRLDVRKPEMMHAYLSFEASESTQAPYAYLVPATLRLVVDRLEAHGVSFSSLKEAAAVNAERFLIASSTVAEREYQGHRMRTITGGWEAAAEQNLPAGTIVAPLDQPLGRLIVLLLEPRSDDGLAAWNLMDEVLEKEKPKYYPILRTAEPVGPPRRKAEARDFGGSIP